MKKYKLKLFVEDREYMQWVLNDPETLYSTDMKIFEKFDPVKFKMLNQDVVDIIVTETNEFSVTIDFSLLRNSKRIPGVLMLADKPCGKHKDKFLYKILIDF